MTRWPWMRILTVLGCLLVVAGVTPMLYLIWFSSAHNFQPLSMPLPLKRGEYASAIFKTDLNDMYQIDLDWQGAMDKQMAMNLVWKVEDDHGTVLARGNYQGTLRGNEMHLGFYRPGRGLRQRIVLTLPEDAKGLDSAHAQVNIGVPERNLDMAYGAFPAQFLAGIVAGPGAILLVALLITRRRDHSRPVTPVL